MFLQTLLEISNEPTQQRLIKIVSCQLEFLLSLVGDMLDIKMIEKGVFEPKLENFNPKETLDFIGLMFSE